MTNPVNTDGICSPSAKSYTVTQKNYPANFRGASRALDNAMRKVVANCDLTNVNGEFRVHVNIESIPQGDNTFNDGKAKLSFNSSKLSGKQSEIKEFTDRLADTMAQFNFNGATSKNIRIVFTVNLGEK